MLTRVLYWYLLSELRSNEGNRHKHSSRVSVETVLHEGTYIILFLTRYNESMNDEENDDLCAPSSSFTRSVFVLLMTSQTIPDDITMTGQL